MPKAKKESKIEKEVRIVERYYSYSITCPYCRTIYDDKLMQCPKCGGAKP
jgi:transposase